MIRFLKHVQRKGANDQQAWSDQDPTGQLAPGSLNTWLNKDSTAGLYKSPSCNPEHSGKDLFNVFPDHLFLGSKLEPTDKPFYFQAPIPYKPTGIESGKLTRHAQALFRKEGLDVKTSFFQRESLVTEGLRGLAKTKKKLLRRFKRGQ